MVLQSYRHSLLPMFYCHIVIHYCHGSIVISSFTTGMVLSSYRNSLLTLFFRHIVIHYCHGSTVISPFTTAMVIFPYRNSLLTWFYRHIAIHYCHGYILPYRNSLLTWFFRHIVIHYYMSRFRHHIVIHGSIIIDNPVVAMSSRRHSIMSGFYDHIEQAVVHPS